MGSTLVVNQVLNFAERKIFNILNEICSFTPTTLGLRLGLGLAKVTQCAVLHKYSAKTVQCQTIFSISNEFNAER